MKTEVQEKIFTINTGKHPSIIQRNISILQALSKDKRPSEIASELFISTQSVRHAIHVMLKKNSLKSVTALVAAAIRGKII